MVEFVAFLVFMFVLYSIAIKEICTGQPLPATRLAGHYVKVISSTKFNDTYYLVVEKSCGEVVLLKNPNASAFSELKPGLYKVGKLRRGVAIFIQVT